MDTQQVMKVLEEEIQAIRATADVLQGRLPVTDLLREALAGALVLVAARLETLRREIVLQ